MHSPWRRMHVFLFLSSVFSLGIDDLMLHPTCYNVVTRLREANLRNLENTNRNESEELPMKIQYNNSLEARIAYIECQTNTLPFVDFSEFTDDPDFHIYPVFGDKMTNTLYTNRDFMEKAKRFSSEECSLLMNLSNAFPTATLIVVG